MIQRIQTIYFIAIIILCAVLCSGAIIKVVQPAADGKGEVEYALNLFYFSVIEPGSGVKIDLQFPLIALAALVMGLTVLIIFSYKDRAKQMRYTKVNFLMMLLLVLAVFSKAAMSIPGFSFGKIFPYSIFGSIIFLFMFYLNWRALRLIKKDDELVKSADRIR